MLEVDLRPHNYNTPSLELTSGNILRKEGVEVYDPRICHYFNQ
jgi:hypothetical protein